MSKKVNTFHTLSDTLYNIKEKLSDKEFIDIMNILSTLKTEKESDNKYKVTIMYPDILTSIDTCHYHPYSYEGSNHEIKIVKRSFITKFLSCLNQPNTSKVEYCSLCTSIYNSNINNNQISNNNCNYVKRVLNSAESEHNKNIYISQLINICDDSCKELLQSLANSLFYKSNVSDISVLEDESDDENEDNENFDHNKKIKKVIHNNINFNINIYIHSIEKIEE